MTTEAEEIDELTTMFQSTGTVTRDSPITASKYNRWLGEDAAPVSRCRLPASAASVAARRCRCCRGRCMRREARLSQR